MFTYNQVRDATLDFFKGDQLAAEVFAGKYALCDNNGSFVELTPADLFRRLSRELARMEAKYPNPLTEDQIFGLLSGTSITGEVVGFGDIVAQGSPMSAMGNPYQVQSLSNCFVIDSPEDSYGGILLSDQEQAQIMKRRGGVGFDISGIRPKGVRTSNAARTTDGIGIFMGRFSNTCREVAQGGRRGALMLTISCAHPEIETFINIKRNLKNVTGANVSIRVTDEFMNAVDRDLEYTLRWPVEAPVEQAKITKVVRARDIWEQIVDAAWASAEPGILFWDTALAKSPADAYATKGYRSISTNPCGEIILSARDSCRLMVVNVARFVKDAFTSGAEFDFDRFDDIVQKAERLMDDIVDLELEAVTRILDKIKADPESLRVRRTELELWEGILEAGKNGRRTGLGITGLGDALAMLGVQYGSKESIQWVDRIYRALALGAYRSTVSLAEERGAFPVYDYELEKDHPFILKVMSEDADLMERWKTFGRRNIALTTTAPVGSVSILTQTTSGIEPVFRTSYKRRRKITASDESAKVDFVDEMGDKWQHYDVYHHGVKHWMEVSGKADIQESPYHKSTSEDIDWKASVDLQAAAQQWICHSISKTCNLPRNATHEVVSETYLQAWKSGCKGFTAYRDGSRDGILLSPDGSSSTYDVASRCAGVPPEELEKTINVAKKYATSMPDGYLSYIEEIEKFLNGQPISVRPDAIKESHAPRRPAKLVCDIHRANIKGEQYLVLVGMMDDRPYEIFAGLSQYVEVPKKAKRGTLIKNGRNKDGIATYNLEIGLADDDVVVFKDVVELFDNPTYGAFTRTLSTAMRHGVPVQHLVEQLRKDKHGDITSFSSVIARVLSKHYIPDGTKSGQEKSCPSCGSDQLAYQQGCVTCMQCGNSKCG